MMSNPLVPGHVPPAEVVEIPLVSVYSNAFLETITEEGSEFEPSEEGSESLDQLRSDQEFGCPDLNSTQTMIGELDCPIEYADMRLGSQPGMATSTKINTTNQLGTSAPHRRLATQLSNLKENPSSSYFFSTHHPLTAIPMECETSSKEAKIDIANPYYYEQAGAANSSISDEAYFVPTDNGKLTKPYNENNKLQKENINNSAMEFPLSSKWRPNDYNEEMLILSKEGSSNELVWTLENGTANLRQTNSRTDVGSRSETTYKFALNSLKERTISSASAATPPTSGMTANGSGHSNAYANIASIPVSPLVKTSLAASYINEDVSTASSLTSNLKDSKDATDTTVPGNNFMRGIVRQKPQSTTQLKLGADSGALTKSINNPLDKPRRQFGDSKSLDLSQMAGSPQLQIPSLLSVGGRKTHKPVLRSDEGSDENISFRSSSISNVRQFNSTAFTCDTYSQQSTILADNNAITNERQIRSQTSPHTSSTYHQTLLPTSLPFVSSCMSHPPNLTELRSGERTVTRVTSHLPQTIGHPLQTRNPTMSSYTNHPQWPDDPWQEIHSMHIPAGAPIENSDCLVTICNNISQTDTSDTGVNNQYHWRNYNYVTNENKKTIGQTQLNILTSNLRYLHLDDEHLQNGSRHLSINEAQDSDQKWCASNTVPATDELVWCKPGEFTLKTLSFVGKCHGVIPSVNAETETSSPLWVANSTPQSHLSISSSSNTEKNRLSSNDLIPLSLQTDDNSEMKGNLSTCQSKVLRPLHRSPAVLGVSELLLKTDAELIKFMQEASVPMQTVPKENIMKPHSGLSDHSPIRRRFHLQHPVEGKSHYDDMIVDESDSEQLERRSFYDYGCEDDEDEDEELDFEEFKDHGTRDRASVEKKSQIYHNLPQTLNYNSTVLNDPTNLFNMPYEEASLVLNKILQMDPETTTHLLWEDSCNHPTLNSTESNKPVVNHTPVIPKRPCVDVPCRMDIWDLPFIDSDAMTFGEVQDSALLCKPIRANLDEITLTSKQSSCRNSWGSASELNYQESQFNYKCRPHTKISRSGTTQSKNERIHIRSRRDFHSLDNTVDISSVSKGQKSSFPWFQRLCGCVRVSQVQKKSAT
ncbi:hypothetical protein EG68_01470 [Paragonimus skrjabini miyazakii]|uniref:Uncharacterized protein n=1 Tax=Paragonimus skrjabini miyazakii TaxID=59628 RepID=A0A8S9Z1G4_9TREM|nr:hypothetical protein EG68_01470 [Paragonimus skrjabini miyazakii]